MSVEPLNPSVHGQKARNALAEIQACHGELQSFIDVEFDRLDALADEIVARRPDHDIASRQSERETMQDQIEKIARVAAEMAELVAEQKRLSAQQGRTKQPVSTRGRNIF